MKLSVNRIWPTRQSGRNSNGYCVWGSSNQGLTETERIIKLILGIPFTQNIRNLVLKTDGIVELLREVLVSSDIKLAFVFGSLAAGSEKPESDLDIMVVGKVSLRQLGKLLSGISTRVAREINPHVFSAEEFSQRIKTRDHFISTVMAGPKMFVIGNEDELETMGR